MSAPDPTSVTHYIAEIQRIPVLSREDEHALAVRAKDDPRAVAELVRANLRYVIPIALRYRRYGVRLADLISEGNVGMMIAARKFDSERGTRFVTYAAHWVRACMLDHVIRAFSIVGVGAGPLRSKVFFRLRREKARILAETQDPDLAEERLAARFGTSIERIRELSQRLEARDISVDARAHDDGSATVLDTLPSGIPSQEERLADREKESTLSSSVRRAVAELDPRERYIIEARILADAPNELSLAEIGRHLGVSRERVRQIEARAMGKLKKRLEGDMARFEAPPTSSAAA
jgi:RNA polymerase sigma-32 factor